MRFLHSKLMPELAPFFEAALPLAGGALPCDGGELWAGRWGC
ncbi:MAG: hypothetical protein OIN66_00340 [Candidatus Methanoperedens sp.]|nr:hypothetical protein [Candidatus Methanoperedens sp.]